ncbi:eukaryotic translation initiation factor-like [Spinacia oleracea]|uniref:Eukaryotic translation initiation factor isoform 4E n=1 Tax=Spinacia oleracea TaxID=3562 RepID=A0A9R0IGC9_SPIOL|nr:eukaryotic translation initiation factor-like [Spinacia oleracea]
MWLETLMALIGEQFDEADEICGVVASARSRGDKLSLWTRNAANEAVQPNDIIAAESEGAMAIGVCTGVFGKEELEQVGNGGAVTIAWMKLFVN